MIFNAFPRLEILDLSETSDWLSIHHVQQAMPMLQVIRGTPLDKKCFRCFFSTVLNGTEKSVLQDINNVNDVIEELSQAVSVSQRAACFQNGVQL